MSQILNELREIITKSEILPEEQNDLLVFLPILPEETIENLIEVFKETPEKVEEFNANFKSKVQAITGGEDEELSKKIEEEEKAKGEIPDEEKGGEEEVPQDNTEDEENTFEE